MNSQLALSFPASYLGAEIWKRQIEVIAAAVRHLGLKEVAFTLDIGPTQLSDALNERDRKYWHGSWSGTIKIMLAAKGDDTAIDLLRQVLDTDVEGTPFAITEAEELTPEEVAARLKRELLKFGDAGKAAVSRATRGGRR